MYGFSKVWRIIYKGAFIARFALPPSKSTHSTASGYGGTVWALTGLKLEWSLTSHPTQCQLFLGAVSTVNHWLILTNRAVGRQENTQTKYSKTKLPWFSRLLRHSVSKRDGLVLQHSRVHTEWVRPRSGVDWVTYGKEHTTHNVIPDFESLP